jgi:hypothetical protein
LDVERFDGLEQMSALYHYTIRFTSSHPELTAEMMLSKTATLSIGVGELFNSTVGKIVHGVVTNFRRLVVHAIRLRMKLFWNLLYPYWISSFVLTVFRQQISAGSGRANSWRAWFERVGI